MNFFNVCAKKDKGDLKSIKASKASPSSSSKPRPTDSSKSDPSQKATKSKNNVSVKKEFPNGLKNTIKFKTKTSTVQALKRKYQEQRLAKQRIKNKIKTSYVIRTRSNSEKNVEKSLNKLSSRKFVTKPEKSKRHGLRSGGLIEQVCNPKIIPKNKRSIKPQKKGFGKNKNNSKDDYLDSDSGSNDEELKLAQNNKKIGKSVPKKICTRKTELRRVTRSFVETKSTQNLSRRPTRKTKEAAAVYMEILGRKLVSPDLENDDDISLDSFPELPNSRRILKEEFEIKEKVKQNAKSAAKEKEIKVENTVSSKRIDKLRTVKTVLKSKRIVKVHKYCELETDEESEISCDSEKSGKTRPMTRRSLNKTNKPANRSLRSSSRNLSVKVQVESCEVRKYIGKKEVKKEKIVLKRKREQIDEKNVDKKEETPKDEETKDIETLKNKKEGNLKSDIDNKKNDGEEEIKKLKKVEDKEKEIKIETDELKQEIKNSEKDIKEESDEETLCSLLSKIKRKRESDDELSKPIKILKEVKDSKMSDDEESFRGFTKKAISKVLDTCQSHVNSNLLVTESIESKSVQVSSISPLESTKDLDKSQNQENPTIIPFEKLIVIEPNETLEKDDVEKQDQNTNKPDNEIKIIDMPSTTTVGRKERVNMSAEQIEKWLTESSIAKEENKVELDTTYNYENTTEKPKVSHHLSISSKIQHLVRPVNVTLAKLHDKSKAQKIVLNTQTSPIKPSSSLIVKNKESEPKEQTTMNKISNLKTNKESPIVDDDIVSKSDQNSPDDTPSSEKKCQDKKILPQPRKLFLPKVKERKVTTPSANAFSPENESSVYAFESDTETPISTPFRRKSKPPSPSNKIQDSNKDCTEKNDVQSPEIDNKVAEKKEELNSTKINTNDLKGFPNLANIQVLSLDKLTTNWSNVNCSASIAVQVNLDDQNQKTQNPDDDNSQQKSTEISTQTEGSNDNDDDNDGQLFYIPLQAVTRNGSNLVQGQQLIQGVAVKLGTEGPTGPNQRVLLKAKLVTKPTLTVARVPPVGTVQPTARAPPIASTSSAENPIASTSSLISNSQILPINKDSQSTSTTIGTEKIAKITKVPRERKMSVESAKFGKR